MNTLTELLSSRVKAEIFRLLFGLSPRELHVRELERQSGLSVSTVRQELKRLTRLNLVVARRDGNRLYYKAEQDHPLFPEIRGLVLKTNGMVEVFQEALRSLEINVAFIFGAVACCQEDANSDVDLMVISELSTLKLSSLLYRVKAKIGREVNIHAIKASEYARRMKADNHFLAGVSQMQKVFVIGDEKELAGISAQ